MLDSFGARLRRRREEQGVDLATIAEQTKIKLSLFEALERDDVSLWPSGIFRRAFVRAYAHAIGLDPDVVVREFLELYPEPVEPVETALASAPREDGAPPTRLRSFLDSALGSLSRRHRSPPVEAGRLDRTDEQLARGQVSAPWSPQPDHPAAAHPAEGPGRVDDTNESVAGRTPRNEPASFELDFLAAAHLCTELGRVETASGIQPLLREAARVLDATGLIVWVWDALAAELRPALAQGYSDKVLAQLPAVGRDADNATAAAFRSARTCTVRGSEHTSGALVVPLLTPAGCAGVLAIELRPGREQARSVLAGATIFAAQLAQLVGGAQAAEAPPPPEAVEPRRARRQASSPSAFDLPRREETQSDAANSVDSTRAPIQTVNTSLKE
jgi:transcriptional regulator with XRE-family HTH domain